MRSIILSVIFVIQAVTMPNAYAATTLTTSCGWSDNSPNSVQGQCRLFITSTEQADIVLGVTSVGVDHDIWGTYTIVGISGGPWSNSASASGSAAYPGSGNAGYPVWIRLRHNLFADKYFGYPSTSLPLNYSVLCQDADNWYVSIGTKYTYSSTPQSCNNPYP